MNLIASAGFSLQPLACIAQTLSYFRIHIYSPADSMLCVVALLVGCGRECVHRCRTSI
jgi:hypothetical protein